MSWVLMIIAILFEVSGTTMMKLSEGFTRRLPTILMFVFYGIGFIPLNLAMRRLPVSVVYAVWSGLGIVLIAIIGLAVFKEPLTPIKVISILLIIAGIVGLNLSGVH